MFRSIEQRAMIDAIRYHEKPAARTGQNAADMLSAAFFVSKSLWRLHFQ